MTPTLSSKRPFRTAAVAVAALLTVTGLTTFEPAGAAAPMGRGSTARLDLPHVADAVIVTYKDGTTAATHARVRAAKGVTTSKKLTVTGPVSEVVKVAPGRSVADTIASLQSDPAVTSAEPDYIVQATAVSDDTYFTNGTLWGMLGDGTSPANVYGTGAAEAWAAGYTGSSSVVVGIIDEGIQVNHPDLAANIWTNPGEIAGDRIDNDGNGYVDDINGWDFFNNDATVFDGANDATIDAHGTHVAGTIGGVGGNASGVVGVNWSVKMISAKFLGPNGGAISAAVSALNYLTDLKVRYGVNIVASSNSWGGGGYSSAMATAIDRAGDAGMLFVAAAGNSATNNDTSANYPSNYTCTNGGTRGWDCVVAVAAIDRNGALASFSQYGATTVDLGAPGVAITSSVPNSSYASYNGTSMATPHVTGAVALCAAINSSLSASAIRNAVVSSAVSTASLVGKTATGGRLDVGAMVPSCMPATDPVSGAPTDLVATADGETATNLTWTDGASFETRFDIERAVATNSVCGNYSVVGQVPGNSTAFTAGGLTGATEYCFRVRAINGFNGGSTSAYSNVATATTATPPPPYVCTATTFAWIDATAGGTRLSMGDDSGVGVTLPFSFRFHSGSFTTAVVSSNGFLRIGSGAATAYSNSAIPDAGDPNNTIAAWWDDLNPAAAGGVWTRTVGSAPNRQFVASWVGVPHYTGGTTTTVSFQIVLHETTGNITLQYLDTLTGTTANDRGASATTGIENAAGTAGTQLSYNSAALSNSTAKLCNNQPVEVPLAVATSSLNAGVTGSQYSETLTASGGTSPYTWAVTTGSLPPGLLLTEATGVIAGSPTTTGTYTFTVTATDADADTATKSLTITIVAPLSVTTSSLANGAARVAYSQTLAATGGTSPYTWALSAGSLPAGLALGSSSGSISGTPTTAGTFNFTVRITDSAARTATRALSITVVAAPGAFNKLSPSSNATGRVRNGLVLSWAASAGATSYEYCYDRVNDKICNTSWISVGSNRTVTISGLLSRSSYFWQVRAVNAAGVTNANNSTWWKFTTAT